MTQNEEKSTEFLNSKQNRNERKEYISPNLIKIGKMQKVTLKGGSQVDAQTGYDDFE